MEHPYKDPVQMNILILLSDYNYEVLVEVKLLVQIKNLDKLGWEFVIAMGNFLASGVLLFI